MDISPSLWHRLRFLHASTACEPRVYQSLPESASMFQGEPRNSIFNIENKYSSPHAALKLSSHAFAFHWSWNGEVFLLSDSSAPQRARLFSYKFMPQIIGFMHQSIALLHPTESYLVGRSAKDSFLLSPISILQKAPSGSFVNNILAFISQAIHG